MVDLVYYDSKGDKSTSNMIEKIVETFEHAIQIPEWFGDEFDYISWYICNISRDIFAIYHESKRALHAINVNTIFISGSILRGFYRYVILGWTFPEAAPPYHHIYRNNVLSLTRNWWFSCPSSPKWRHTKTGTLRANAVSSLSSAQSRPGCPPEIRGFEHLSADSPSPLHLIPAPARGGTVEPHGARAGIQRRLSRATGVPRVGAQAGANAPSCPDGPACTRPMADWPDEKWSGGGSLLWIAPRGGGDFVYRGRLGPGSRGRPSICRQHTVRAYICRLCPVSVCFGTKGIPAAEGEKCFISWHHIE